MEHYIEIPQKKTAQRTILRTVSTMKPTRMNSTMKNPKTMTTSTTNPRMKATK